MKKSELLEIAKRLTSDEKRLFERYKNFKRGMRTVKSLSNLDDKTYLEVALMVAWVSRQHDITLDDPIEKFLPRGYRTCPRCHCYSHHPLRWCPDCPTGTKFYREKKMSWRKYIKLTRKAGSGPLNTFTLLISGTLLYSKKALEDKPEKLAILKEANEIYDGRQ